MELPAPAASERAAILKHEIQRRSLDCSDVTLQEIASKCDGYDAYDLVHSYFLLCCNCYVHFYKYFMEMFSNVDINIKLGFL